MSSYFLTDFLYTCLLFLTSYAIVVAVKAVYFVVKEKYFPAPEPEPEPKPKPRKKRQPKSVPKPIRSIEIDPEQVEKIYVKKSS